MMGAEVGGQGRGVNIQGVYAVDELLLTWSGDCCAVTNRLMNLVMELCIG